MPFEADSEESNASYYKDAVEQENLLNYAKILAGFSYCACKDCLVKVMIL